MKIYTIIATIIMTASIVINGLLWWVMSDWNRELNKKDQQIDECEIKKKEIVESRTFIEEKLRICNDKLSQTGVNTDVLLGVPPAIE